MQRYVEAITDDGKTKPPRGMKLYNLPTSQFNAREAEREKKKAASDARWEALAAAQNKDGQP